ncbi:zinc-ribbon domain-containing protein [Bacillus sp. V3B]|uniref:zinc ribbon domain-containing protein n=1 Tax=Bacillus sp. V3B TaxID=2804915 RepID=UPI00210C07C5|nr:zinc-ribbon domain-containing protein [Bacillus sp. V3B]MCQ6277097.1 zinc-ribbon domain-containing protein [Bacillus sp. V3B]
MEYCKHCGNQLKEGAVFCKECGQPVKSPNPVSKPTASTQSTNGTPSMENQQMTPPPPRKPLSKKAKVLTTIAVTFAILLVGSYYVISNMFGPEATANQFMEAIESKDTQKVKQFINEGQLELSVDDEQTKAFITYLHEDPRMITAMSESFNQNLALYESTDSIPAVSFNKEDSSIAQLKDNGKKWLIFDYYVVQIKPIYAKVSSSEDKTDIYFNDKKEGTLKSGKEKTFGPFLPGVYDVKAIVNGEYGEVEQEDEIDTSEIDLSKSPLKFRWSDYYVDLYSYDDAILYVNGKSTEETIYDIGSLGPIPIDGSIKVYAEKEFPSGVKKSQEVTIKKGMYNLQLDIKYNESEELAAEEEEEVASEGETEKQAIENSIISHYSNISADDFSSAHDLFSSSMKKKNTLDGWREGLEANIRDDVTTLEVESVDGNSAKAYIEMTSYDNQEDGTILVQEWGGYWNLVKENGQWTLDDPELKKLDSRVE